MTNIQLINIVQQQNLSELKSFLTINKNLDLSFTTESGDTLLHFAASKLTENTLSIIQILLENGLDPLAVNQNFQTSIEVALENNNIPAMTIMKHYVNKKMQEAKGY